ncbi:MAG TPA: hypothetical protein VFK02_13995 [Kofleriaceae bacterium]|nr:hypothetical protein [Kofleriaceae bacterium]
MEILIGVVAVTAGLVAMFAAGTGKQRRHVMLRQLATTLGGRHTQTSAYGHRGGADVRFEHTTRGAGKTKEYWTTIDVTVLAVYPLALHVRRHRWFERDGVARGGVVDLPLGDRPFDEAFLVEAAPEDIARVLLDAEVRDALMSYERVELDTVTIGNSKVLRLAIRGWIVDASSAGFAIDLIAGIGGRVQHAFATVDGAVPVRVVGSPYRPELEARPLRDVAAARFAEVAMLEERRARRARRNRLIVAAAVVAAALLGWLILVYSA